MEDRTIFRLAIGDIGNHLRHAYNQVDAGVLWSLYDNGDLASLDDVIGDFLQRLRTEPGK